MTVLPANIPGVPNQLIELLNSRFRELQGTGGTSGLVGMANTRQRRISFYTAASVDDGTYYTETDTGLLYQRQAGKGWVYVSGVYQRLQAELVTLAATLNVGDEGLEVDVTDYGHTLAWDGAAWAWGPNDARQAGQICFFDVAPGSGWKLLNGLGDDGSAIGASHPIKILKSDGTTRSNTTAADLTAGAFLKATAAYDGTVTAATLPTLSGSTASGQAVIGVDTDAGFAAGAGATAVALKPHTHVDTGHIHGVGTLVTSLAGGDPIAYSKALPYIRK